MKVVYRNFAEHQLVMLYGRGTLDNTEIKKEWFKRYSMNFPYKTDITGKVFNCITQQTLGDSECDKLILEQAKALRERRATR
ncbi:hypothetical protein BME96_08885 [Virgibacillus halodenitrificans]|uniref:Uncharacterized protein n=1 Tax=Virgibacillus halodenitrificans TaxID=1482 RepID=A0AAC9IYI8_VIRHA|nr:hypothetical protein [Virgibacillus halodenitrificans]APC48276.1 hypothetical protein BME96_08885 [Virgibacillus halodenitrificans]